MKILPLVILPSLFALWVIAMCIYVHIDWKWSIKRGTRKVSDGRFPACSTVLADIDVSAAQAIAARALQNIGGHEVQSFDDGVVSGWIGSPFLNWPAWAEYQLVVSQSPTSSGSTSLTCRCRPRNAMAFPGSGISQKHADSVAAEIVKLTNTWPTVPPAV